MAIADTVSGSPLERVREDLRKADVFGVSHRRAIVTASLLGMASMAMVTLFQTGLVRHLPDPPLPGFDSDKVNSSDLAYRLGVRCWTSP